MGEWKVHPMLAGMTAEEREAFLQEMHDAYAAKAEEAEALRVEFDRIGDRREMKVWRDTAKHCRIMSELVLRGILDPPEMHGSKYSYDEAIGDASDGSSVEQEVEAAFESEEATAAVGMVETEAEGEAEIDADADGVNEPVAPSDEETPQRDPNEDRLRRIALVGGTTILTPKQHEVAEIYMGARVSRTDAPDMIGVKATMTFDTHVRDIKKKWADLRTVTDRAF